MNSKLVSIIMPSYNSCEFIRFSIDAIINQSYTNWELLITDDCSSDSTYEILEEYSSLDSRIKIFKLDSNCGAAVARNFSISQAEGDYIAFCDSDDLWIKNKLKLQVKFMSSNSYVFSYSSYAKIKEDGTEYDGDRLVKVPPKICKKDLLKTCSIGCLTAMYDSSKIGKIYMPLVRKRQDYALWLKILDKVDYAYGIEECLCFYRVRSNSISSNKFQAALFHYKVMKKYGGVPFVLSLYYFMIYSLKGLIKYIR